VFFELSVTTVRPTAVVFAFLRDKHLHVREPGSPVVLLEKATPGEVAVGTRFREVVRMLPGIQGEIRSIVTRCEPDRALEEDFAGAGMRGHLAYEFVVEGGGTRLVQRQTLVLAWWLRPLQPLVRWAFGRRLHGRLDGIADSLEAPTGPRAGKGP